MLGNPSFVLLSKERFEVNSGTVEPRACDREGRARCLGAAGGQHLDPG